jgi:hypothetical protein
MMFVLDSSVVDRGFESQSDQTKNYKVGINLFLLYPACGIREKDQRLIGSESR